MACWLTMLLLVGTSAFVPLQSRTAARARSSLSSTTVPRTPLTPPKEKTGDPDSKSKTSGGGGNQHQLLLFDDPVNTREYVSRVLCTKVGLGEVEAYDCMMQAHINGVAVVGVYQLETAELYCKLMKDNGLVAAVKPVNDNSKG
ncbi:hypothetical protein CTAYLR_002668 [Chrysophaeum taylorii]|uniref:Adaptor protein ClpS core domain-containing protein n=1 Tax=Chrysophaeum taylorii TaxID=2483200 RepID=A0AAD7XJN4_9STRA|nr:hypothetical protein CTAYLR_002668 [Chrysophaeum taylorii]